MTEIIKDTDRSYFAGLFDGEGTVLINKTKTSISFGYNLRVQFSLTYKSVLLRMQKCFGGNIHTKDMNKVKNAPAIINRTDITPDKWKQAYNYTLSSRDALYFLKIIEPFCDEKKQQVSLGIRFEQGKRSCTGGNHGGRSKHEIERCEFFRKELQRLKHEQPNEDETETEYDFVDQQPDLFSFVKDI